MSDHLLVLFFFKMLSEGHISMTVHIYFFKSERSSFLCTSFKTRLNKCIQLILLSCLLLGMKILQVEDFSSAEEVYTKKKYDKKLKSKMIFPHASIVYERQVKQQSCFKVKTFIHFFSTLMSFFSSFFLWSVMWLLTQQEAL